jgi:hypothetical protein
MAGISAGGGAFEVLSNLRVPAPRGFRGSGFSAIHPQRTGSIRIVALQGCQKIPTLTNQRVGHPQKQTQLLCVDLSKWYHTTADIRKTE